MAATDRCSDSSKSQDRTTEYRDKADAEFDAALEKAVEKADVAGADTLAGELRSQLEYFRVMRGA